MSLRTLAWALFLLVFLPPLKGGRALCLLIGYVSSHHCWECFPCFGKRCPEVLFYFFIFFGTHWAHVSSSSLALPWAALLGGVEKETKIKAEEPHHSPWICLLWNVFPNAHFFFACVFGERLRGESTQLHPCHGTYMEEWPPVLPATLLPALWSFVPLGCVL